MNPELIYRQGSLCDLVYSPDDGGWYLQRHSDDATSQIFDTSNAARFGQIVWTP